MQAFRFPLTTVLKYRQTQLRLHEAAVGAAAARLASIESLRVRIEAEFSVEAERISSNGALSGEALASWTGYSGRVRRQIAALDQEAAQAREHLSAARKRLVEADRDVRLVEELKKDRFTAWRRESEREEAAMADEAFLAQWESGIIGKRGGA